ncbi:MAG TPA: PQQ-dependent sugar dehydrogenase, partial [Opitutaceae bacterium]|nr:PQQ-dependent sugar dehydrogenase [Opitutaceae bacterium]
GKLWLADVGLSTREEINLVTRGANYGWEYREGLVAGPRTGTPPAAAQFVDPIWDYGTTQGFSITGGPVYRGTKLPGLTGQYIFADFVSGRIWALADNGARPVPATQVRQIAAENGITGITVDASGDILFADYDSNQIKRLVLNPNASGAPLPATLADTGIFSNVATLTPAAGVVPYSPNVSFWSDHAIKTRWFALPDTTSTFGFNPAGAWTLPPGAVWVKHFDLQLRRNDPTSARRIETRVLVRTGDGLYGATYQWNDAQTSATLVPEEGATKAFTIIETNGTTRTQQWTYPGRTNCLACHTERGGGVLSFNTRQLNRPAAGDSENQLTSLVLGGYLANGPTETPSLPALANPADTTKSVEQRARSYLDANCAQCHQPGGTALGAFDARAATPLSLTGLVNGPVIATSGIPEDRVIAPGDAAHSMLLRRLAGVSAGRMPPLGSTERDLEAEALLATWVTDLARPQPPSQLLNLAARAAVGTGGDVLIPGFVIAGAPKPVLVRAVGPTLRQFGLGDALAAPVLTLFNSDSQIVAINTRWTTAANVSELRSAALRVGAFPLPEDSADSAMLITLAPGAYTAQTAGANSSTGVALVEVYDASVPGSISRLVNTAVRAQVGTGANILIPGLVVSAGAPKTVLIRAVGPGLATFGVPGPLAQPMLTLFAGPESYVTNTAWNTAGNAGEIRAAAEKVGAFRLTEGSRDSAMLVSLSPGAYTVQVSGVNGSSGVALVEVYDVP